MVNRVTENAARESERERRRGNLSKAKKKHTHETDTVVWTITSVWRAGGRNKSLGGNIFFHRKVRWMKPVNTHKKGPLSFF